MLIRALYSCISRGSYKTIFHLPGSYFVKAKNNFTEYVLCCYNYINTCIMFLNDLYERFIKVFGKDTRVCYQAAIAVWFYKLEMNNNSEIQVSSI